MSCNTYDSIGSKFSPRILSPEQARARLMTIDQRIGYESNPLSRRDSKLVTSTTSNLINKLPKDGTYPILEVVQLTPSIIADFTEWAGYTDFDLNEISFLPTGSSQLTIVYQLLEYHQDNNFARSKYAGSSCSSIVNALSQVIGFLSSGAKLLSNLMNFSLGSILSQLMSWKTLLTSMVDELVERMLTKLNNFANQILSFGFQVKDAVGRFLKKIEKAKSFFSDLTIESIKAKIEEIIAKVAGQFEDITPKAIAHILMIICQLADSITSFMQSPLDAITNAFNFFTLQQFSLQQFTNDQIAKSVESGNPRMAPEQSSAIVNKAVENTANMGAASHLRSPNITDEEKKVLQQILSTGTATSSGVTINHSSKTIQRENDKSGGWSYVINYGESMLYVVLFRIAKAMGENFTVTCGYRSPEANASIRNAAKKSLHMRGLALDVSMGSLTTSQKARFVDLASSQGLGGIQYYPRDNFTHIDVGAVRWWPNDPGVGGEGRIPSEIKEAIYRHLNGTPAAAIASSQLTPSNAQ
jgi:uncharacterized protein YcbK (DUF882 family)